MKRITLDGILASLTSGRHEVTVDKTIAVRTRRTIEAMLTPPDPVTLVDFTRPARTAQVEVVS